MHTQSNKIDFNGQHIYAGIDVHLKSWNVTVITEGRGKKGKRIAGKYKIL